MVTTITNILVTILDAILFSFLLSYTVGFIIHYALMVNNSIHHSYLERKSREKGRVKIRASLIFIHGILQSIYYSISEFYVRLFEFQSPLHLSNSDGPGSSLVTQPLICSDNYPSCARSMIVAVTATNKIGFVNGEITMT